VNYSVLKARAEASGFVVMKRPPRAAPTTGGNVAKSGSGRRRLKEKNPDRRSGRGIELATTNLAEPPPICL
jgi:hypothetical protein